MLKTTYKSFIAFAAISTVYVVTRWAIFKSFNGTDDLHYAMLAANMLKGKYNPFASRDIFSGRVWLIAWQAMFYRLGGINVFTTQAPAILAVLLSCWLTVFKLLRANSTPAVVIVASLFYFNPVLTYATDGILPDVYVMLAGIIIILLWQKSIAATNTYKNILNGAGMAVIVSACFFFKETAIVFPVLTIFLCIIQRSQPAIITCTATLVVLLAMASISATIYYHFTGEIFFRLQQVNNSSYYNPCSYDILPASFLIIRLTYGVWKLFLVYGFYPVLFAVCIVCYTLFSAGRKALQNNAMQYFLLLLVIALYLPFSFSSYQPLCSDSSRHFLFLLPFGVGICAPYLFSDIEQNKTNKWMVISIIMLVLCMASTPDKWQWMVWALLIIFFTSYKFIHGTFFTKWRYVAFATILWVCMPYRLFYENSNWFADMRQLNKRLAGSHYYFADHDNMMHWKLLHSFSDTIHCYNMDPTPFNVFRLYYDALDTATFNAGWLLINKKYTERSDNFLHTVDSLQTLHYFNKQIIIGDMQAYYINQTSQLAYIKNIVGNDAKVMR